MAQVGHHLLGQLDEACPILGRHVVRRLGVELAGMPVPRAPQLLGAAQVLLRLGGLQAPVLAVAAQPLGHAIDEDHLAGLALEADPGGLPLSLDVLDMHVGVDRARVIELGLAGALLGRIGDMAGQHIVPSRVGLGSRDRQDVAGRRVSEVGSHHGFGNRSHCSLHSWKSGRQDRAWATSRPVASATHTA